jgi:hypothetical protein
MSNKFIKFWKGIRLKGQTSDPTDNSSGSLWYNSVSERIKGYFESAVREVVTTDQTQTLSNKTISSPTYSGTLTTPLTASKAAVIGASSELAASTTTSTELGYVSGVTSAIQTQLNSKLALAGGTMTGALNMGSHLINNLTDPSSAQDAATKNYVDGKIQGIGNKLTARAATTGALAANTYANGTSGVGATLTGNSNGALASQDGVTLVANDTILVKDESTASHNGLYVVTQVGDGSNPYILTRSTDADSSTSTPARMGPDIFVFVQEGTTLSDTGWVMTTNAPITMGSTSLNWVQFSAAGIILAGQGLTKTVNTLSITPLTSSRAVVTDGSGNPVAASATTSTEIGYVNGVTSAIQTQLNTKAPLISPSLTRPVADNFIKNYATTATAAGTTTLVVGSAGIQYFTGSTTQNVKLPDATTLPQAGFQFFIVNTSSGVLTIKDNGSNTIGTITASSYGWVTVKDISTSNGSWDINQSANGAGGGTVTSVAQTVPGHLSVAGSPITTSGTLALTLSGSPIAMANGTAAAPSYNFSASTSTGMYSSSANVLDWSTNGTQRLELGTSLSLVGQTRIVGASYNDTSNNSQLDIRNVNSNKDVSTRVASFGLTGANDMTGSLFLLFYDGDGNIGSVSVASSTSVAYNTTSDKRLKTNVQNFSALPIIENMQPVSFEFKKEQGRTFHGFLAQDLYEVYPEAITKGSNEDGENPEMPWSMDYGKLTPICIKGIQELQSQIEDLKREIAALKAKA